MPPFHLAAVVALHTLRPGRAAALPAPYNHVARILHLILAVIIAVRNTPRACYFPCC
jgi:hypothetical protein